MVGNQSQVKAKKINDSLAEQLGVRLQSVSRLVQLQHGSPFS